jgi:hypothetical protein
MGFSFIHLFERKKDTSFIARVRRECDLRGWVAER